jgi:hypothetical protein
MAQDSDQDDALNTHALDMVTLPGGQVLSEVEADMIRGVLEANGIPSMMNAASQYPNFGFEVKVPRGRVQEAERLIEQARAAGPDAAEEAERQTEG